MRSTSTRLARPRPNGLAIAVTIAGAYMANCAQAYQFDAGQDWKVHWDNTLSYNLGVRMKSINHNIGDSPVAQESDYKFQDRGDVVTNRVALLSEFDAVFDDRYGMRISASGWNDFAYDDNVETNPGSAAPGVPYSSLGSRSNGKYGDETEKYYLHGAQLLDAFVFSNFTVGDYESSVKAGRLTQYWGNSLFFGSQGISYSQNASDLIKAAATPGTQAKELAIPRTQLLLQTQLSPEFSLSAQYFLEYQENLMPEGGTYLGPVGFLFQGPDQAFGGQLRRAHDDKPDNINNNFGLRAAWTPQWLDGTLSAYYRRLDETQAWAPLFGLDGAQPTYRLGYAEHVNLYGLSLDTQVGPYSTGFEVSYRQNTALNSTSAIGSNDTKGARGDTLNVIANVLAGLTPTDLYDTGTALAEIAYTRKLKVTDNKQLYNGVHDEGCGVGQDKWDGCSTDDAVQIAVQFTPQWLQVWPGVDLDSPMLLIHGLYGNGASLNSGNQGSTVYSLGLHALMVQKYNVTLAYNGYHAHTSGKTSLGGNDFYAGGNGAWMYNDKDWLSLTFSTSF